VDSHGTALAWVLIIGRAQLVTLKYTQYGGEGYLRDGIKEFSVRENSFIDLRGGQGRPPFFIVSYVFPVSSNDLRTVPKLVGTNAGVRHVTPLDARRRRQLRFC
jgi:hypothetical protein